MSAVSNHEAADGPAFFEAAKMPLLKMRVGAENAELGMTEGAFLYILRCADGSFYIGTTRAALEMRIAQHNAATFGGYTASRLPVTLVFSQWFDRITDAIENERKLKKWSRAKKEAFIRGDFTALKELSVRRSQFPAKQREA